MLLCIHTGGADPALVFFFFWGGGTGHRGEGPGEAATITPPGKVSYLTAVLGTLLLLSAFYMGPFLGLAISLAGIR